MGDLAFLGNPEFGVEFTPIDFTKFAEACGAKGYTIKEPSKVKSVMRRAMSEKNPTIIEAYVDPFEPPMPSKVDSDLFEIWRIHLQRDSLTPKGLD
jgi:pyruvate dehydrogenase (quinone)/pyruvate oxidase